MMASTVFPQDGLPEGALPDHLPFLGRVNDHVHANARPQDIGDDIPKPLGKVAVRPSDIAVGQGIPPRPGAEQDDAFGSVLQEGPDDAAEHGVTPGVLLPHRLPSYAGPWMGCEPCEPVNHVNPWPGER
jgi:hypothetical protein